MQKNSVCLFNTSVDKDIATMLLEEFGYTVVAYPCNAEIIVVDWDIYLNKEYVGWILTHVSFKLIGYQNDLLLGKENNSISRMD